jgi:magnesium-transporting ATPase (P-type)
MAAQSGHNGGPTGRERLISASQRYDSVGDATAEGPQGCMTTEYLDQTKESWSIDIDELMRRLNTKPEGLTSSEAEERLSRYGPNLVTKPRRLKFVRRLLSRLGNPLVLILLGAAAVSAFTGDMASFVIITLVVGLSIHSTSSRNTAQSGPSKRFRNGWRSDTRSPRRSGAGPAGQKPRPRRYCPLLRR